MEQKSLLLVFNNTWILQWGRADDTDLCTYPITFKKVCGAICVMRGSGAKYCSVAIEWNTQLSQFPCHRSTNWGWNYIALGT